MTASDPVRTLLKAFVVWAFLASICGMLPDVEHQRWELTNSHWYNQAFWCFERIHYDPRPIDVAILGSSKTLLGINSRRLEEKLAEAGFPLAVANLSILAPGRNAQWKIVEELLGSRPTRLIVLGVDDEPYPWGHLVFQQIGSRGDIAFPPQPFLKSYFKDLLFLPGRQLKLFAARFAPDVFDLKPTVNLTGYTDRPPAEIVQKWNDEGTIVDRDEARTELELKAQFVAAGAEAPTRTDRLLLACCNEGDDHAYLRRIAGLAEKKNARLFFLHMPSFGGATLTRDSAFLGALGTIVDGGPISAITRQAHFFESWRHLNRSGANEITDYLARNIAGALRKAASE